MSRPVLAGVAYFAVAFAGGFVLGTARVLVLAPWLGETGAVALELPITWIACGWLLRRLQVPPTTSARLLMGSVAFAALIGAETGLGIMVFGRSLAAHADQYRHLPGLLGLAGQLVFATFPLLRGRRQLLTSP